MYGVSPVLFTVFFGSFGGRKIEIYGVFLVGLFLGVYLPLGGSQVFFFEKKKL